MASVIFLTEIPKFRSISVNHVTFAIIAVLINLSKMFVIILMIYKCKLQNVCIIL